LRRRRKLPGAGTGGGAPPRKGWGLLLAPAQERSTNCCRESGRAPHAEENVRHGTEPDGSGGWKLRETEEDRGCAMCLCLISGTFGWRCNPDHRGEEDAQPDFMNGKISVRSATQGPRLLFGAVRLVLPLRGLERGKRGKEKGKRGPAGVDRELCRRPME